VILSIIDAFMDVVLSSAALPLPPGVARIMRTLKFVLRCGRAVGKLARTVNAMMKAMQAKNTRKPRIVKVTEAVFVDLTHLDDDDDGDKGVNVLTIKQVGAMGKPSIPDEYKTKWAKAFLRRSPAGAGRVSISLYLKADVKGEGPTKVTAVDGGGLFTWRAEADEGNDENNVLSFRPIVFQRSRSQLPIKLELMLTGIVGVQYVYHEDGRVELQQWKGKQIKDEFTC